VHTCFRHRRSRTTVFEGELDIITAVNTDDAPSHGIPGWISAHDVIERESRGHTHSPLTFRAALMTSGNPLRAEDRQDNRIISPTENWTSSGVLGGDGVCLFFRLPIMRVLGSRKGGRSASPFLYPQYGDRPAIQIKVEIQATRSSSTSG
jgi:hypothetical protein